MVSAALIDRTYRPGAEGFSLAPAAATLFEAFADLSPEPAPNHCPHCLSPDELALAAGPAASLPPELAAKLVRKAGATWDAPGDLRRLTPRLLTLAADHRLGVDRALLFSRLRDAGWVDWPARQRDAVGRFLLAEFARLLRNPPRPAHAAHRWISQVSAGIDDLGGFLTVWHDSIGPLPDPPVQETAVAHLVELLTTSPLRPDLPATVADAFPLNPLAGPQVTEFLCGPGVDLDLRRAATELADTPKARRVNVAVERLRRFRAAVERGS